MKQYPSIPRATGQDFREFPAHVFDKLDGSNLRFEWNRKRGWHKQGTRHRLFDLSDPDFGKAIPLFTSSWAEALDRKFTEDRVEQALVFFEYWDITCLGGRPADPPGEKRLTLFDVNLHRRGFVPPLEFVREYSKLGDTARYLGEVKWTRSFVGRVYNNDIPEGRGTCSNHGQGEDQSLA